MGTEFIWADEKAREMMVVMVAQQGERTQRCNANCTLLKWLKWPILCSLFHHNKNICTKIHVCSIRNCFQYDIRDLLLNNPPGKTEVWEGSRGDKEWVTVLELGGGYTVTPTFVYCKIVRMEGKCNESIYCFPTPGCFLCNL